MFTNRVTLDENLNFDARYADDTTLIAAVFERLQLSTDQLQEACKKYGMKISIKKCKIISDSTTNLTIEDEEIEIVKEFKNLELMQTLNGQSLYQRCAVKSSEVKFNDLRIKRKS